MQHGNIVQKTMKSWYCMVWQLTHTKKGYGKAFVAFYENYAKRHNCIALRMDTNVRNAKARNLYRKLGYEEIGVVKCVFNGIPDVQLVCLEKYLE